VANRSRKHKTHRAGVLNTLRTLSSSKVGLTHVVTSVLGLYQ